jgi:hypothetical protein
MEKLRVYVSSSSELVKERYAALDALNHRYGFFGFGMEYYYAADANIVAKCVADAASADYLVLIVAMRYGTTYPDFDGKSLVELEYEAARNAGRKILAFCRDMDEPQLDDRIDVTLGVNIKRFRQRVVDDRCLVKRFSDLESFNSVLNDTLSDIRQKYLERKDAEIAGKAAAGDPTEYRLKAAATALLNEKRSFNEFYVPLAASTTARKEVPWPDDFTPVSEQAIEENREEAVRFEDVVHALEVHSQFYLVAEPGGGKTLSLTALEIAAATRFLTDPNARFPLQVDVSSWMPEHQPFEKFIESELERRTNVDRLPWARLLLLVDGVIDSAAARPDNPSEKIHHWLTKHPACSAVLAARGRVPLVGDLPKVRIHSLDSERIRNFVHKRVGDRGDELLKHIGWHPASTIVVDSTPDERDIQGLIKNPFNLTLLCKMEVDGSPPTTQADLIQRVVHSTYRREALSRNATVAIGVFITVLGSAAVERIRQRANLASDISALLKSLSKRDDLDDIIALATGCGIIQARHRGEKLEFTHRLYLEYFAAEYVRANGGFLVEILGEPRYEHGQRLAQRFDEVIHTLIELAPSPQFIAEIAAYDPLLAAMSLSSFAHGSEDRVAAELAVVKALESLLGTLDSAARNSVGAAMAKLGPAAVSALRRVQRDGRHWIRRTAVQSLACIYDTDAVAGVVNALVDNDRWVRNDAEGAIRRFDDRSRQILLELVSGSRWEKKDRDRRIDERLANVIANELPSADAILNAISNQLAIAAPASDVGTVREHAAEIVVPEDDSVADDSPNESWGSGWLTAWRSDLGNQELQAQGLAWLRSAPWHDQAWGLVWTALSKHAEADSDVHRSLAVQWLKNTPAAAISWSHVWQVVYPKHSDDPALAVIAWNWLRNAEHEHAGWAPVWLGLWRSQYRHDDVRTLGLDWIASADPEAHAWSHIWTSLHLETERYTDQVIVNSAGHKWIAAVSPDNASWGIVWAGLWDIATEKEDLAIAGKRWAANAAPEHESWGAIWPRLRKYSAGDRDLEDIGRRWLGCAAPSHPAWPGVWESLRKSFPQDLDLFELASVWLSAAPRSHRDWLTVWRSLHNSFPASESTLTHIAGWFQVMPAHPQWGPLFEALWDRGASRAVLAPIAVNWLTGAGSDSTKFSFVWERLWADATNNEDLVRVGLDWLARAMNDPTWSHIWVKLWRARVSDSELTALIVKFLTDGVQNRGWGYLWQEAVEAGNIDEGLIALGLKWLRMNSTSARGWARVWAYFTVNRDPEGTFKKLGWSWMAPQYFERNSWSYVWETLWQKDQKRRAELAELAIAWLVREEGARANEIVRWKEIEELAVHDENRRAVVHRLLAARS